MIDRIQTILPHHWSSVASALSWWVELDREQRIQVAWGMTPDGSSISFSAGKLQSVSTEQVMGSFLSLSRMASKGCSYCSFYKNAGTVPC